MKEKKFLVLDVETANGTDDALVYDVGFAVVNKRGRIFERHSYVVADVFCDMPDLMETAYYAVKIPQYRAGLRSGKFIMKTLYSVRAIIKEVCARWEVKGIFAYNAFFDKTALTTTQRYVTKSKYRWFLPYGIPVYCIWHMACQTICMQRLYRKFCIKHGFVSAAGNIKTSAEVVYAYLNSKPGFEEQHMGLDDVEIETYIMARCFRQHKPMKKTINRMCWRIPQIKVARA